MKNFLFILVTVFLALIIVPGTGNLQATKNQTGPVKVQFDPRSGMMSIAARDGSLQQLIMQLRDQHGIDLSIPNLEGDDKFTCNVINQFIDEALRQAIPSRYYFSYKFRGKNAEFSRPAPEPRPFPETASRDKTAGGETQPAPQSIQINADAPQKELNGAHKSNTPQGGGEMGQAASIREQTDRGPQRPAPHSVSKSDQNGQHVRLIVRVTERGFEPVELIPVDGQLIQPETVDGRFVYRLQNNGNTAFVGSFSDPLEQRSIMQGERPHHYSRAQEAYISLPMPGFLLSKSSSQAAQLEFFEITGEAPPLLKDLGAQKAAMRKVGEISPAQLSNTKRSRN